MRVQAIATTSNHDTLDRARVVGDALHLNTETGLTAAIGSGSLRHGGYWFFELEAPFITPGCVGQISAISFDAAFRSTGQFSEGDWIGCTVEVVIRSRVMDLYVVSPITPVAVAPGIARTKAAISLSTSESWRLAMDTDQLGEIERVRVDLENDPLANSAEIIEGLSTATSVRLVFSYPPSTEAVELCGLSLI